MADENQPQFEDEELDTLEDFDDEADFDEPSETPAELTQRKAEEEERRLKARREIERRNELKALKSELDEWDDMLEEVDL